ncbi:AAA family ATPase [Owenweeksia hongkongensis]|uniref:AAA family ATPase n=1 Tax=Owenweeksia hongkongensis TaxID=253245 RepID=UPI003A908384
MKIARIELHNHPIFGTTTFNFCDQKGKVVNTIFIAGDNGVGKTALLELVYEIPKHSFREELTNEKLNFELELTGLEIDAFKSVLARNNQNTDFETDGRFMLGFDFTKETGWKQISFHTTDVNSGNSITFSSWMFYQPEVVKSLKVIFSDVEINYNPKKIKSVTALNIDTVRNTTVRSSADTASDIAQLLIDIKSLDDGDLSDWAIKNVGKPVDPEKINVRLSRFTDAFNQMFPAKRFKGIENVNGEKKLMFEENGIDMPLEKLSSGEKQIVFRGSFLLRDKQSTEGALIIVDEPEISLHPKWQLKIANFYKKLYTDDFGIQKSQIFFATHSPFIIHNPNRNDDKVIVLRKNLDGNVLVDDNPEFYDWAPKKTVEQAFNLKPIIGLNKPVVLLEGITDEKYFRAAQKVYALNLEVDFRWVGRLNDSGRVEFSGDTALNQAKLFLLSNKSFIGSKTILLYDCDTNKIDENYDNLHVRSMRLRDSKAVFKKGVENLLVLPKSFDYSKFRVVTSKTDDYGNQNRIESLDKVKLCSYICEELDEQTAKMYLSFVKEEIERLNKEGCLC